MRRLLVLVLLAGLLLFTEQTAYGCSCATGDPRTALAGSNSAFVGKLVQRENPSPTPGPGGVYSSGQDVTYTFAVERSVKGDLGTRVDVEAAASGASCGIEARLGERIGLLLYRDGDQWKSGLCSQMDPDVLIKAAEPLPAPNGSGPVRFLVGGRFGGVRVVALDGNGKTLAYGKGEGHVSQLSVCPNARRFLEISIDSDDRGNFMPVLTVREVSSLRIVSERPLKSLAFTSSESRDIGAIRCLAADGSDLYLFVTEYGEPRSSGSILKLEGKRTETVYQGDAEWALFFNDRTAYVTGGPWGDDVLRVDLSSGGVRRIARDTGGLTRSLSVSPDGTRLAGVAGNWKLEPNDSKLVFIDMRKNPAKVRKVVLGDRDLGGPTLWHGNDRIVVPPGDGTVRIFDTSLERRSLIKGWQGNSIAIAGKTLYGCGGRGWVGAAELPDGSVRKLHAFESPELFAFAVLPAAATAPKPRPISTATPTTAAEPTPENTTEPAAAPVSNPGPPPFRGLATSGALLIVLIVGASWLVLQRRHGAPAGRA